MVRESEIREGELAVEMPKTTNAGRVFIGRIRTPWTSRLETPRQGRHDGPVCRLEIFEPWVPALTVRPNPIGTSTVELVGIEGNVVLVRGLDCLDETPLLDIKPDRCEFTPLAPPQPGDFETE